MTIVYILLVIFFAYAFAGIIGFLPFIAGFLYSFFMFLIKLVEYNLYPVGPLPKILIGGTILFIIVMFIIKLFAKNHN